MSFNHKDWLRYAPDLYEKATIGVERILIH